MNMDKELLTSESEESDAPSDETLRLPI